jgi:hypothetical protein
MRYALAVFALILLAVSSAPAAQTALTGRVVDPNAKAVPGAHVYVYTAIPLQGPSAICPSCYVDCGKHEQVAANGEFRIGGLDPKLQFRLLAVAKGYEPAFSEYSAPGEKLTFTLKQRAAADEKHLVRGRVVDPHGKPVVGAVVTNQAVRTPRGKGYGAIPGVDRLSITGEDGEFALRVPDDAIYLDVQVRARNFAPKIARELVPGDARVIAVDEGAALTGTVAKQDGTPVRGVVIKFTQQSHASDTWVGGEEIATDERGRFLMTGLLPNEKYVLFAKMESAAPLAARSSIATTGDLHSNTDAGTLVANAGYRVAGRVVNGGRDVPAGTRVVLARSSCDDMRIVDVGPQGAFSFDGVPRENVRLILRAPGRRPSTRELFPGEDIAGLTFEMTE